MKVQVEELSPIERKLSIEVEAAVVAKELDRAYAELGRRVKLSGFRPGKIPRRILEQKFKEQVEDDVIQRVVQKSFVDAIREKNVEAVSNPQVTNKGLNPDAPFHYEARVEVKPQVTPKDYVGLKIKKVKVSIEDAKVEERLEQLRDRLARLEPAPGGREVAQEGDFAQMDFTATIDGQPFSGSEGKDISMEVGPGELSHGKVPQLAGLKAGQTTEFDYAFPKNHPDKSVREKKAHFKATLKSFKIQVKPDLAELAQELKAGQTPEQLKAQIRTDLEVAAKSQAAQEEREALIKALVDKNTFEIPKAMEERAIDVMLRGAVRVMAQQGVDVTRMGLDFDALREQVRPRARLEVQGTLLFQAIADKESVQATEEEVDQRIEQIASEQNLALSQVKKQFRNPDERRQLQMRVREEKTVEFLKSKASYS